VETMTRQNLEFTLQVHKMAGTAEHEDLYTIGIWQGTALHAICHVQPLSQALDALCHMLGQAGKPQPGRPPARRSKITPGTPKTGLGRIAAAALASLSSLLKPVR
jgi:hypothetical protein